MEGVPARDERLSRSPPESALSLYFSSVHRPDITAYRAYLDRSRFKGSFPMSRTVINVAASVSALIGLFLFVAQLGEHMNEYRLLLELALALPLTLIVLARRSKSGAIAASRQVACK